MMFATLTGINYWTRQGTPLSQYLESQVRAAVQGKTPGTDSQRARVNPNPWNPATGNTWGGVNTNNFIQSMPEQYAFDPLQFLSSEQCGIKIYISSHHYLQPCGVAHNTDLVETDTMKLLGVDTKMFYSTTPFTGTIAKLLPKNWHLFCNELSYGEADILCFETVFNTYIGAADTPDAERKWVCPVLCRLGIGAVEQFPDSDPLSAWQKLADPVQRVINTDGDSGSPIFCGINNDPVLVSFVSSSHGVGLDNFAAMYDEIVQKMRTLASYYADPVASTYAPQIVDLTGL